MSENDWRNELTQESLDRLKDDSALVDFIELNAEKALNAAYEALESIEKKALQIASSLFIILSGLSTYIVAHYNVNQALVQQSGPTRFTLILTIYLTLLLLFLITRCYLPRKISIPGNKPSRFINDDILSYNLNYIRIAQMKNTESYINHMKIVLEETAKNMEKVLLLATISPAIAYSVAIFLS